MHENIKKQIIEAMRAQDTLRLEVLRGLQSAFSYELIAKKSSNPFLKDEDALNLIRKAVKQRKDSIEQFEKGGRKDLVKKEKAELVILEEFLPAQMSKKDVEKIVKEKIKSAGKIDKAKSGKFIGMILKELKGKVDGSLVKEVVDEML